MGASHSTQTTIPSEQSALRTFEALRRAPKSFVEPRPIVTAVLNNDVDQVKWLLSQHLVNIDERSACGDTLLHTACRLGNVEVAKALLEYGADSTIRTTSGRNCLHQCILGMRQKASQTNTVMADVFTAILCSLPPPLLESAADATSYDGVSVCHLAFSLGLGKVLLEVFPVLPDIARLTTRSTRGETPENCVARLVSTSSLDQSADTHLHWKAAMKQRYFVEVDPAWWVNSVLLTSSDLSASLKALGKRFEKTENPELCIALLLTNSFISNYIGVDVAVDEFYLPPGPETAFHAKFLSENSALQSPPREFSIIPLEIHVDHPAKDLLTLLHRLSRAMEQLCNVLGSINIGSQLGYEDMFGLHKQLSLILFDLANLDSVGQIISHLCHQLAAHQPAMTSLAQFVENRARIWPFKPIQNLDSTPFEALRTPGAIHSVACAMTASIMRGNVSEFGLSVNALQSSGTTEVHSVEVETLSPSCFTDLTARPSRTTSFYLGGAAEAVRVNRHLVRECSSLCRTQSDSCVSGELTRKIVETSSSTLTTMYHLLSMLTPTHHPMHLWMQSVFSEHSSHATLTTFLKDTIAALSSSSNPVQITFANLSTTWARTYLQPPKGRVVDIRRSDFRLHFLRTVNFPNGPYHRQQMTNSRCIAESTHQFVQSGAFETRPIIMSVLELRGANLLFRSAWDACALYPRIMARSRSRLSLIEPSSNEVEMFLPVDLAGKQIVQVSFPQEEHFTKPLGEDLSTAIPEPRFHVPGTTAYRTIVGQALASESQASSVADVHTRSAIHKHVQSSLHILGLGTRAIPIGPGTKPSSKTFRQLEPRVDACFTSLHIQSTNFMHNQLFL